VILPTAVYYLRQAQEALGLPRSTLGREIRLGRLRSSRRAGKCMILGCWLLEWISQGEHKRQRPPRGPEPLSQPGEPFAVN
jgi:hypothetical protein